MEGDEEYLEIFVLVLSLLVGIWESGRKVICGMVMGVGYNGVLLIVCV